MPLFACTIFASAFLLFLVLMLLAVLLMMYAGKPILRRVADWLLNRRGFEKLGRPIRVRFEDRGSVMLPAVTVNVPIGEPSATTSTRRGSRPRCTGTRGTTSRTCWTSENKE